MRVRETRLPAVVVGDRADVQGAEARACVKDSRQSVLIRVELRGRAALDLELIDMPVYRGTEAGDGGEGRVPRIACGETDEIVVQIQADLAREDGGRCLEQVVGSDEIVPMLEMGDDGRWTAI